MGKLRFAGDLLQKFGGRIGKNLDMKNAMDWGIAIGPDVMFGGLAAAMTPGDLADKAIAGAGSAIGGAGGGLLLRGAVGPKNDLAKIGLEMAGGIGGDMAGMSAADAIMRVKGGGTTPWEKMSMEQEELLRKQVYEQIMSEQGLI